MGHDALIGQRQGLGKLGGLRQPSWWLYIQPQSKEFIIRDIEAKVAGTPYSAWRIGLTHNVVDRRKEWSQAGDCVAWRQWMSLSLTDAQDIEALFIRKGMKGGTGGNLEAHKPIYVYVF